MQKLTAIILSSRDIGEFDRIYTLYSRESGLLRVVGKGVRKQTAKLAGHLEPGTLSEIYVARSRGMGQITSAITLDEFKEIKNDFELLNKALEIFQFFVKNFSEEEKDERIFNLLKSFLENLRSRNNREILAEAFWWKLFDALGNRPETMKCSRCGANFKEEGQKYFSAEEGGIICKNCASGPLRLPEITPNQIKMLRVFLANPLGKILKVKTGEREIGGLRRIKEEFRRYNFS
jgi:DNA repair protein RecO (recombination protein O)